MRGWDVSGEGTAGDEASRTRVVRRSSDMIETQGNEAYGLEW